MEKRKQKKEQNKKLQQDLEDMMYETLKEGGFGPNVMAKYPHQSAEELAAVLTEGIATCKAAFKTAVLRLIIEAKGSR